MLETTACLFLLHFHETVSLLLARLPLRFSDAHSTFLFSVCLRYGGRTTLALLTT